MNYVRANSCFNISKLSLKTPIRHTHFSVSGGFPTHIQKQNNSLKYTLENKTKTKNRREVIKHEKSKAEVKSKDFKQEEACNLGFGHGPQGPILLEARHETANSSLETIKN